MRVIACSVSGTPITSNESEQTFEAVLEERHQAAIDRTVKVHEEDLVRDVEPIYLDAEEGEQAITNVTDTELEIDMTPILPEVIDDRNYAPLISETEKEYSQLVISEAMLWVLSGLGLCFIILLVIAIAVAAKTRSRPMVVAEFKLDARRLSVLPEHYMNAK